MAKFEEEKVITALHPEKAEVGKKYWFADNLLVLKRCVEENDTDVKTLNKIRYDNFLPFQCVHPWQFLYPYEEPPKKRMTNRQTAEWLVKGNGELTKDEILYTLTCHEYYKGYEDKEVDEGYLIRPFGQTDWIEPTVDIYERDCKGGKK